MKAPRHGLPSPVPARRPTGEEIAVRIQHVLASRELKLSDVARESRLRFRENRAYCIPHHFYADLRIEGFSPRMEQVLAFSAITNYRLVDWLTLFGFHLDEILRLTSSLPTERTILLDSSVYDDEAPIGWFRSKATSEPLPAIALLGQLLEPGPFQPLKSLWPRRASPFVYAKVGRSDAFAFPDLLPGSIVRVDRRFSRKHPRSTLAPQSLFLVEHSKGLTCCRLHVSGRNFITMRSTELPFAEVALRLGSEARVHGKIDLEFRFLAGPASPGVARELAVFWNPEPVPLVPTKPGFAEFVRRARDRVDLSLREASARSRRIVEAFGDGRYFCARDTLLAYETNGRTPRHIHKILALCVLYSLRFWQVLGAAGWETGGLGSDPIPRASSEGQPCGPRNRRVRHSAEFAGHFLSGIVQEVEEIPFFLRNSLGDLTGLEHISLRDIIWLGGLRSSLHPYLSGALFAVVDGRQKRPPSMGEKRLWEEPLYLVLRRDGSYLCTRCTLQDQVLVLHPFADSFGRPVYLRNGVDAEVVGRVVALVRRL